MIAIAYPHDLGYWMSLLAYPASIVACILIALLSKVVRSSRNSPVLPRARVTRDDRRTLGTRQPRPEPLKATRW